MWYVVERTLSWGFRDFASVLDLATAKLCDLEEVTFPFPPLDFFIGNKKRLELTLLFKVWSMKQQHPYHLGAC